MTGTKGTKTLHLCSRLINAAADGIERLGYLCDDAACALDVAKEAIDAAIARRQSMHLHGVDSDGHLVWDTEPTH